MRAAILEQGQTTEMMTSGPRATRFLAGLCICAAMTALAGLPSAIGFAGPSGATATTVGGLPRISNLSDLSDARAGQLVTEALSGLGFKAGAPDGPQPNDRVFVGNRYIAWIDETGFYGKMNGLWWLSPTVSGDRSFTMRATDGRPVSQFMVGENGDGAWPKGIRGAEHIEVPNDVPEAHHNPNCAKAGGWCAQYSMDEAGAYTQPGIPWWHTCDPGAPSYLDHFDPIEITATATSLRLVYEGRLVKAADSKIPWHDQTGCHEDWLFRDGIRRPVYLRVGYELFADSAKFDRIQQIRNPVGNPAYEGPFSVIGGFEMTTWPNPRPDKALNNFIMPETKDVFDPTNNRTMLAGTWNTGFDHPIGSDIAMGWLGQPMGFSSLPAMANGKSLRLSNVGPSDNLDTGFCLCQVHGTLELGGGLLHSAPATDASLPIDGGEISIEARRRLETAEPTAIADVAAWSAPTTPSPTPTAPTPAPATPAAAGAIAATPAFTG